jgi:hypothetical protein
MNPINQIDAYYKRLLTDRIFVNDVLNAIKDKLGRDTSGQERIYIFDRLTRANPEDFAGLDKKGIFNALVGGLSTAILKYNCNDDTINIHEILKSNIGVAGADVQLSEDDLANQVASSFGNSVDISSVMGLKDLVSLKDLFTAKSIKKNSYIFLDTRYRLLTGDNTVITWNFVNNANAAQGTINAIGDIQNITSMRIHPFKIPYVKSADSGYGRVSLLVNEFSAQSYIAHENTNFHAMFMSIPNGKWIELQNDHSEDNIYKFNPPITRLDSVTISFGSPLESIIFDLDRLVMKVTSYTSVDASNLPITILANPVTPHGLETTDLVYISSFNTLNPDVDVNAISSMNNPRGLLITKIDDFTFSVPANTAFLQVTGPGTIAVTFGDDTVTGTGTAFDLTFYINDRISINGVQYAILKIVSSIVLTLATVYNDVTASGLTYKRDNTIPNLYVNTYFGSKRIMIPMEFEYFNSA